MKLSRKIQRGNANLLRLADILDRVPPTALAKDGTPLYDQSAYVHECGAPSCALGHWAAHNPRWIVRGGFVDRTLTESQKERFNKYILTSAGNLGPSLGAKFDFGITYEECEILFSQHGCGRAGHDPKRAAAFIRNFVKERSR